MGFSGHVSVPHGYKLSRMSRLTPRYSYASTHLLVRHLQYRSTAMRTVSKHGTSTYLTHRHPPYLPLTSHFHSSSNTLLHTHIIFFFFKSSPPPRDLPFSPTRRSPD